MTGVLPLSTAAVVALWGCAIFLASAACFATLRRLPLIWTLPAWGIAAFAVHKFRVVQHPGDIYEGLGDAIVVLGALAAILLAVPWTALARHLARRRPWLEPALLALPALAVALFAVERQRLPDAACVTDGVTVQVGALTLAVPVEFAPWIETGGRSLPYRLGRERKEAVRTICGLTAQGRVPLVAEQISVHPNMVGRTLDSLCATAEGARRPACRGYRPGMMAEIGEWELIAGDEAASDYVQRWFDNQNDPRVDVRGDAQEGSLCLGTGEPGDLADCFAWGPAGPGVVLRVRSATRTEATRDDLLAAAAAVSDHLLSVTAP